ncbi:MAG: MBL fold metallo-hydrolase, partial [Candidatus Binatia bacterium]
FAELLEHPSHYDLPCMWYDPIPVDRVLQLERPIHWEEYEITLYEQPGHTRFAVAISFEVDGKSVLAIGDQYENQARWNYVYCNRFGLDDYRRSAALYQKLHPDLILAGHFDPLWVTPDYLDTLVEQAELLAELHEELLTMGVAALGADGVVAAIRPYQSTVRGGEPAQFVVEISNPFPHDEQAVVRLVTPEKWRVEKVEQSFELGAHERQIITFEVLAPVGIIARRARIAADLTIGAQHFGQQAEALVTVVDGGVPAAGPRGALLGPTTDYRSRSIL